MRVAIVIGVDEYQDPSLGSLNGAHYDADRVFKLSIDPDHGQYDPTQSRKLLSPSLAELRAALQEVIYAQELDTLTFFFAGHGLVSGGSLYLCVQDTKLDRLAATAFSFSEILRLVSDAQPASANIVIDACESGGVVNDLTSIINPSLLGEAGTPSICVVAASMSNQGAGEDIQGGYLTSSLLRCVSGEERLHDSRSHLNLIEIGERASQMVVSKYPDQTPVCWGLNLFGSSSFCVNPHFDGGAPSYVFELVNIPPASESGRLIKGQAKELWRMAEDLGGRFSATSLIDEMRSVAECLPNYDGSRPSFVSGLAQSLPQRAAQSKNIMCQSEILACCIVALLGDLKTNDKARGVVSELFSQFFDVTRECTDHAVSVIESEKYQILSREGGLGDLYFVPIRLIKLLGWISALLLIEDRFEDPSINTEQKLKSLIEIYKKNYLGSLVAVSDEQAPYLLIFLEACKKASLLEEAEPIIGCYVDDFIANHGRVSEPNLRGDRILRFLVCRAAGDYSHAHNVIRQPSEFLSVVLKWMSDASLEAVIDPHLKTLDHESMNIFVPDSYTDFGARLIENGKNLTFQIGGDVGHGIFSVDDFTSGFQTYCQPEIEKAKGDGDKLIECSAILASMLLPNRVPWIVCV